MSTPQDAARVGVIHDLGYRHYTGERAGSRSIAFALFVDSLRGAFGLGRTTRSKLMPAALLVAVTLPPVIIAIVIATANLDELPGEYTDYVIKISVLLSLFVAGQAPASVSRDLRFRVVALYFSRPLQRIEYVVAKYVALATAALAMMVIPLTVMFLGALLAKLPLDEQAPNYLRSLGGAVVTALLIAGVALVIAAVTPRRGIGVAAIIVTLLVLEGIQGAMAGIAEEEGAQSLSAYASLISPYSLAHGVQSSLLGGPNAQPVAPPGAFGGAVFTVVALAVVATCFALLWARYRKVSI
ncbi:MAG: ABC transporter permease [Sporichthyaceae bacterium]